MLTMPRMLSGLHVQFFREGVAFTVPSSGTAGRQSKPGAADTGWVNLGIIEEGSCERQGEEREIFAPVPGARRLYDVLRTDEQLNMEFTASELSPVAVELAFGTLALTASSTQFNPLEGAETKGWLKFQIYSSKNVLMTTIDVFCVLTLSGPLAINNEVVRPEFRARVLHSTLNTASLTTT